MTLDIHDSIILINMYQRKDLLPGTYYYTGGWVKCTHPVLQYAVVNMLSSAFCNPFIRDLLRFDVRLSLTCAESEQIFEEVTMFIIFYNWCLYYS